MKKKSKKINQNRKHNGIRGFKYNVKSRVEQQTQRRLSKEKAYKQTKSKVKRKEEALLGIDNHDSTDPSMYDSRISKAKQIIKNVRRMAENLYAEKKTAALLRLRRGDRALPKPIKHYREASDVNSNLARAVTDKYSLINLKMNEVMLVCLTGGEVAQHVKGGQLWYRVGELTGNSHTGQVLKAINSTSNGANNTNSNSSSASEADYKNITFFLPLMGRTFHSSLINVYSNYKIYKGVYRTFRGAGITYSILEAITSGTESILLRKVMGNIRNPLYSYDEIDMELVKDEVELRRLQTMILEEDNFERDKRKEFQHKIRSDDDKFRRAQKLQSLRNQLKKKHLSPRAKKYFYLDYSDAYTIRVVPLYDLTNLFKKLAADKYYRAVLVYGEMNRSGVRSLSSVDLAVAWAERNAYLVDAMREGMKNGSIDYSIIKSRWKLLYVAKFEKIASADSGPLQVDWAKIESLEGLEQLNLDFLIEI